MGDENGCGVRRGVIGPQLNVGRSDAQHKSAESFLVGRRRREQEYRISVERRWRTALTKRLN
jgi:hypothetical protein